MSTQWGSKGKNQDIFLSTFKKLIENIALYKKQVFFTFLVAVSVVFFVFLFFRRRSEINVQAANILNNAQQHYLKQKHEEAISLYDEIINNYPQSQVVSLALFFKGNCLYEEGKYKEASTIYKKQLIQYKKSKSIPFVEVNLGSCYEEEENWEEALKIYEKFVENNPEHMLVPGVYLAIARSYEELNKKELAISTYQKIIALYSDSLWEKTAKFRLKELDSDKKTE